jgi:hypothetical protein
MIRATSIATAVTALVLAGTSSFAARQQQPEPVAPPGGAQTAPAPRDAAPADAGVAAVVVTSVEGGARARDNPNADWQIVTKGMRLPQGAEIQTGARSRVFCSGPGGHTFVVDRLSTVTVLEADQRGNKATTDLLMEYGRADLRVQAAGLENDAKIRTPGATASVRGTALSVYNQPPFAPELRTFTGVVDYRYAKRQITVAKGGRSEGGRGAAETAMLQQVVDPSTPHARTNADASLITEQASRGAVVHVTSSDTKRLAVVSGGSASTDAQLQSNLPGRLTFAVRWTGNADVDIFVAVQPGDPTQGFLAGTFSPSTILYPGFGLETSPATGGRIPYNHLGGPNGGQELCFWTDAFPTAVYGFSAINNSSTSPANVRFNAYLDGQKISLYTFAPDGSGLIRSKGVRRTVAPEGTESTIVAVPPSDLFELIFPESPDETLDGTAAAPPPAPAPPPTDSGTPGQSAPVQTAAAQTASAQSTRGNAAARKAARQQARAQKQARTAAAREAKPAAPKPQAKVRTR